MPTFRQLTIDLTSGASAVTDVSSLFATELGGTGVAMRLLAETGPEVEPFDPAAPIIFAIGPFSSVFPVATKTVAMFRSPLNGHLGESHAGGRLAMAMYGAGFHVLKLVGRLPHLSYLVIDEDRVTIRRASSLQGMSALATERCLRDREDSDFKRSIIRIGPAGERRSPMAAVTVDGSRHFGRLGLGAVMGSKNLKAIVISGGRQWPIEHKALYNACYRKIFDAAVNSPAMKKYHELGTPVNVLPLDKIHGLPTRNFSQGSFEGAPGISGEHFAKTHLSQQTACSHCPVGCIHLATLRETFATEEHHYKTFKVSYDHELIYAWGSNLSIGSSEGVLALLVQCEKQGWDAISMGVTLAWAIDAFQHGLIDLRHTDGLVLDFGHVPVLRKVLQRIIAGHNEFFRDLEQGAAFCAAKYGGADYAIAFGKLEAPGYSTGLHAFLGYATGVRHSHLDSAGYSIDQAHLVKPKTDEERTRALYDESVWRMIPNSLVLCLFARNVYTPEIILEGLNALGITGWDNTRLLDFARRVHAAKNRYRLDRGFRFETLALPRRLLNTMTSTGHLTEERWRTEVDRYRSLVEADLKALAI